MPKCQEFVVPAVLRILEESIPQSGGKEPLDTKPYRCVYPGSGSTDESIDLDPGSTKTN